MRKGLIGLILLVVAFVATAVYFTVSVPAPLPHRPVNAFTNYGQGHAPQPGHCPENTIEFTTDEGLFLECARTGRWSANVYRLLNETGDHGTSTEMRAGGPLPKAPAKSDPDAPPVPPEVQELISRYMGLHSTSEWFRFNTLREAAIYATTRAEQCSHYYECSGTIVVDPKDKRFVVSPLHTDYSSDSVRILMTDAPSDWTMVATFHSHPCVPHHAQNLFSPQDIMGSITHRLSNYMVDMCTGAIHEFIIGKDKPDTVFYDNIWMTPGTIIGRIEAFPKAALANDGL